jgi:hypothetical protein
MAATGDIGRPIAALRDLTRSERKDAPHGQRDDVRRPNNGLSQVAGARGAPLWEIKVPRHIRFVPELPTTVTGKAQKFKMRQAMMRELGLDEAQTA